MSERKRGIYRYPDRGVLDVFMDIGGVWMYALPGEVGDVPEDWWSVLRWEGPRLYPPPEGLNPDLGTFFFLSSSGRRCRRPAMARHTNTDWGRERMELMTPRKR